jgi:hypothetical protein
MDAEFGRELVPGRGCGSCDVCCVALTIDEPQLQKLQGHRCPNLQADHLCRIYESRPRTCSAFYCGFRRLKWVRDTLRPDVSGVLFRIMVEKSKSRGPQFGVIVTLLHRRALKAEGLAETLAAAVNAGIPVHLHVPGPPGHTAARARINDALAEAVTFKNKAALLAVLKHAYAQGRKGDFRPIVLDQLPAEAEDDSELEVE